MSKRNQGIELLRLVLMFMVCMLHILGQGGLLNMYTLESFECKVLLLFETVAFCAVDSFAIISGYVASNKPTKYSRLIELWFQVLFYSCILNLFFRIAGLADKYDKEDFIVLLFPVTSDTYWYFTAYFSAFIFFPLIKKFVFELDEKAAKKWLIVLFIIFTIVDMNYNLFMLNGGYSLIWIMLLYMFGALAKKSNLFAEKKTSVLVLILVVCSIITWLLYVTTGISSLLTYTSPTILLNGMILVIVFSRIQLKGNVIGKISPLAFGIYLFQLNPVIWDNLEDAVIKLASSKILIVILQFIGLSLVLFILGLIVDLIRKKLFDLLHIHRFSELLEQALRIILSKCIKVLR
ncbi:acyltransferase family protein [Ruminococcus sp.]|uniref:acyltransferase family protein n=1 Tax=Ruminococcus sp. TaxID=41978 RepID=UPI0025D86295|nr:acyltransferase family protein [Ruminococcus sp.]MCR4639313.1 acyltransferase [Ruminococcus sp.]